MKVTVFKPKGNRETMINMEIEQIVDHLRTGKYEDEVREVRRIFPLIHPKQNAEGRIVSDYEFRTHLPRLCFAGELKKRRKAEVLMTYNGLLVLEANNLESYEEAARLRDEAARLPQTLLSFVGCSGRSVKIVCRGRLLDSEWPMPGTLADMQHFHLLLYRLARKTYNAQLDITLDTQKVQMDRTVYMSADPDAKYRPQAVPFYIDLNDSASHEPKKQKKEADGEGYLMPGRSQQRTWSLNYHFILTDVLGHYFELPDEEREAQLLMQLAARCQEEGIPQQQAQQLTMLHPVFCHDALLVEKTFESAYLVEQTGNYLKRNKMKPLKSVPDDTMLMMKTDIFLHTHYEMRKNIMTGVAQYRENNGEDGEFHDLDDEARNEMTIRAKELGLKTWDKDIARFIDSPRIEKYDPVNAWLDQLPAWDGEDRVAALAERVPTNQPQWEKYLHIWLLAMVAHWQGKKSLTGNALVPLLIGRQGCGKSSFCRILLPKELRDYYNDRINFKNETDLNLGLTSFALINIDEFDKTTQRQQVLLKYLLSTADVKFRPPYGKAYKQYRRYASFIGTTNQRKPLTDPTGSRRFVCVEVTDLIDFSDTLNHRQLYAQLKEEVATGMRYWLCDEEITQLIEENERFQRIDSLTEMLCTLFRLPEEGEKAIWYSATEILELLKDRYGKTALKNVTPEKIGRTLAGRPFNYESDHKSKGNSYLMIYMDK